MCKSPVRLQVIMLFEISVFPVPRETKMYWESVDFKFRESLCFKKDIPAALFYLPEKSGQICVFFQLHN